MPKANPKYRPGAHFDGGWLGSFPWGGDGDPKSMGPAGIVPARRYQR